MRRGQTVLVLVGSVFAGWHLFSDEEGDIPAQTSSHSPIVLAIERDPDVPSLPFDDNPDPSQCGIPVRWGDASDSAGYRGYGAMN